ncbi:MAG TPA: lamin tail domain-containing protein, partial [Kofleriaceae bacterium]|nr:lamin tail domain-containing protein [Kofleriaceae bacterium]
MRRAFIEGTRIACTVLCVVAAAAACGGRLGGDGDGDGGTDAAPPPASLCAAKHLAPWTRSTADVGGAATFTEVMYHPAAGPEWLELHNPFAIDFELSGFRLDGAVHLTFADGTRIPPGGYLVVASSAMPGAAAVFTGTLPDDGGTIELWNNAGRLIDTVSYRADAPGPVGADGT